MVSKPVGRAAQADACMKILDFHGDILHVLEVAAIASHRAGRTLSFRKVRLVRVDIQSACKVALTHPLTTCTL